jgi:GNAT superfamily N-acetyltransferase
MHQKEKYRNCLIIKPPQRIDTYFTQIEYLYVSNGWGTKYPAELLRRMFHNTYYLVAISSEGVGGILRAFTDGVCVTHLTEILVHPNQQRMGVGQLMMKSFLEDVSHTTIYAESLYKEAGSFLSKQGFTQKPQLTVYARRKDFSR